MTAEEHKAAMKGILEEYVSSNNVQEASQCLRDLSASYFHHEFVKLGLVLVLEKKDRETGERVLSLLQKLSQTGQLSENQIKVGFERVTASLEDLVLDYPDAKERVMECAKEAKAKGWLVEA